MDEKRNEGKMNGYRLGKKETEEILKLSPIFRQIPREERLSLRDKIYGYFRPSGEVLSLS